MAGHLSRRRKTSNRNQVAAGASPDLLEGRKTKEKPGLRASPHEPCHRRRRTVAHAACATRKTDCSRTYDTMAVQLSLERCGVVLLDCSRGGTAPGSQPQRSPTSATDCDSNPSGLTMDGQSRTNGQQALKIVQWNAEGVRLKKTELQHFLKLKAIDVCCIQETHLSSSHRFFIRGYEVFRQDRENRPKGGLLTVVRNNIPAVEIQRSGQADLDTEYLGVKLVLAGTPVTVFRIFSPPDKQIQLHNIKVEPQSWVITGDFNSHSPSWGYGQVNSKGEEVENWITENRLIPIIKPDDPDTFYSRTWRTTTPDLAIATDDIQGIAEREVSSQLGDSDHRPVIVSIKGQTQPNKKKLPASKETGMLSERPSTGKPQHWNCQKPTSAAVLLFSTRLFLKQQRCSSQEEGAVTINPTGLQSLTPCTRP